MRKLIHTLAATSMLASLPCQAIVFGNADSRTQALGGTAVALGESNQGFLYNPALIALHRGDEDTTKDGRAYWTLVVDGISDGAQTAADAITDDLESELSEAINNLNADTDIDTARAAILAAQDLGEAMRELEKQNIYADLYTGYGFSEPGDREGGAFFAGSRLMAVGRSNIEQSDLDLLDDYLEALAYIESFGTEGQEHPELIDENGAFIDPSDNIQSSATGSALLIGEAGIAAAFTVNMWGQDVAIGVSPKLVYLRNWDERWGVDEEGFNNQSAKENKLYLNFDLGFAWTYKERWRVGFAVKDVLAKRWNTDLGQRVELNPQARLGVAYWGKSLRIGLDVDVDKADYLQSDLDVQWASIGAEWQLGKLLALRMGYRQDLQDSLGSATSAGIALRWKFISSEFSVNSGEFDLGAAIQLSFFH